MSYNINFLKSILATILCVAILICSLPIYAFAYSEKDNNELVENIDNEEHSKYLVH